MDFLKVSWKIPKKDAPPDIYPKFIARKTKDLMIRGGDFYAMWDEAQGLWTTDQDDVVVAIDHELDEYKKNTPGLENARVLYLWDTDTGMIDKWHKYIQKQLPDNYHPLDEKIIFANTPINREDYASKRLSYSLEEGDISAYDELISTLYSPEERHKIEWAIGSVVNGDSKYIQKFLVFYGSAGTGKSTILNIIQKLFDGYYTMFDAKALGSMSDTFALEPFKSNPLVAIQHDGDLSRIEDNTRLNSVVSHEEMTVNEKFKSQYTNRFRCMLFMGTNRPVRITDSRSGIIRRLIDVVPTEKKIPINRYRQLVEQIDFELGAIAFHCLKVYEKDKFAYEDYIPINMIGATNDFYNFIEEHADEYIKNDCVTLTEAWASYKFYCEGAKVPYPFMLRVFREELKSYFNKFEARGINQDGERVRSLYSGFKKEKLGYVTVEEQEDKNDNWLVFNSEQSILDKIFSDCPAQLAYFEKDGRDRPAKKWDNVKTKLSDIDTRELHYVKPPDESYIFIDFDLKDETGKKSLEKNMEAAKKWPKTYAELSKSGVAIHLHYIYKGNVGDLDNIYAEGIEIKVFKNGTNSSIRRKLSKCNDIPIATLNSGLPLKKGANKVVDFDAVKSEKGLRAILKQCLDKKHHGATKPEVDFIFKILEDANKTELKYDVCDMRPAILAFAANSSHQAGYCIDLVSRMKFKSEDPPDNQDFDDKESIIFFDVEVFPNLFVVVWKKQGDSIPVKMINPNPQAIEGLLKYKLVGFNCRRYDNHILYARMMGYSNEQLFNLSQKIISGSKNAFFSSAYNISYTDIYDFSSKKQSLKKFEIELGIHHQELGMKWDEPVPEDKWDLVADYCVNDVIATEATFEARKADFMAREILADLTGLTVNDTTRTHATKFIFGNEKKPELVYTDLSEMFPGYEFDARGFDDSKYTVKPDPKKKHKSFYRGEDPGEGGYVYAEPGMYSHVALLDIASMHPTSIIELNLFGKYTAKFKEILEARLAIKHKDFDRARKMLGGVLSKYLDDESMADALASALKIVINSVYGFTTATFDNPFKDIRNIDNIVAKRGALFMIDLKLAVQEKGFTVAHIKTDSIKIPNATPEIIEFIMEFGKKYGYNFEHEATYDRMCLVNDAVYIAKIEDGKWTATGAQFQVPYVFKKLFSGEEIVFDDLCETKTVQTALYLDMNEDSLLDGINRPEGEEYHNYIFVGKAGRFCPIRPGLGGGELLREKDGKYYAATGTKGYRWLESEVVKELGKEDDIDISYYENLCEEAEATINQYGEFDAFVSDEMWADVPVS